MIVENTLMGLRSLARECVCARSRVFEGAEGGRGGRYIGVPLLFSQTGLGRGWGS